MFFKCHSASRRICAPQPKQHLYGLKSIFRLQKHCLILMHSSDHPGHKKSLKVSWILNDWNSKQKKDMRQYFLQHAPSVGQLFAAEKLLQVEYTSTSSS